MSLRLFVIICFVLCAAGTYRETGLFTTITVAILFFLFAALAKVLWDISEKLNSLTEKNDGRE